MAGITYNSNSDLDLSGKMMIAVGGVPVAFATTSAINVLLCAAIKLCMSTP